MPPMRRCRNWFANLAIRAFGGGDVDTGKGNLETREAWIQRTLSAIEPGSRILDAGAGERQYEPFCRHLKYVSQDLAEYDGKGDGCGLHTGKWAAKQVDIVSDICEIPVEDASFDAVMCIEVLEHVPNPVAALGELGRILRPGGTLVLTAPFAALTHFSPFFYSTGFSRNYYLHWLPELGMEVTEAIPNGNYFEWLAREVRRLPDLSSQVYSHKSSVRSRHVVSLKSKKKPPNCHVYAFDPSY